MTTADFETELKDVFAQEARELLDRIEQILLEIEQTPPAGDTSKLLQQLRRSLHTLKGAAGALEFDTVIQLCHALEDRLSNRDNPDQRLDASTVDVAYEVVEYISDWLDGRDSGELQQLIDRINADTGDEDNLSPGESSSCSEDDASSRSDTATTGAGSSPPANTPSSKSPSRSPGSFRHRTPAVRVDDAKLDDLQGIAGELVVLHLQHRDSQHRVDHIRDGLATVLSQWRKLDTRLREIADQIPPDQWRDLERYGSEIALGLKDIYQSGYDYSRWYVGQLGKLERIADQLEDRLRTIRMQPLGPFFDGFARVVREAARSDDKKVRFLSEGREIEVDRAVLQQLREPLIHLVRNAVAHGIEPVPTRRARGKSPTGQVRLQARSAGEKVQLTVSDDGAGIDAGHIRQKAVDAGIVSSPEAARRRSLIDLLAHPGFTTRDETDAIAGRGVGMEAVDAVISDLGGTIDVETSPEQGTSFRLTIPTSITTSQGLIADVGPCQLGIQLDAIERVIRIDPDDIHHIDGKPVIYHDDQPVTTTALAQLVGMADAAPSLTEQSLPALILRHGDQRLAVTVDALPGQMPMVVKPLGPQFDDVRHLAGGAIRADGSILPVLEHRTLFRRVSDNLTATAAPAQSTQSPSHSGTGPTSSAGDDEPATILVVDDSITTRTLERNILEAAGHRVLTAKDGAEALRTLQDGAHAGHIDLVVTDLEMPRVGGLELCRTIRDSTQLELPVIIVTSRGDDAEIRQGMEAGADAYIVKGNFDQDHFMATVNRFVH